MKFEIFIDKPTRVEVEANSYEEAIKTIQQQFNLDDMSCVKFSQAIEIPSATEGEN